MFHKSPGPAVLAAYWHITRDSCWRFFTTLLASRFSRYPGSIATRSGRHTRIQIPHSVDLLITPPDDEPLVREEVLRTLPTVPLESIAPGLVAAQNFPGPGSTPPLVFARQILPEATPATTPSIRGWAEHIIQASAPILAGDPPWRLHIWPRYGDAKAGQHRCQLIAETVHDLLGRHHRQRRRRLEPAHSPFSADHALVQLMLTAPDQGFLSLAASPTPFQRRLLLSAFPAGEVPVAVDKAAPSRAFAKLVEAEARLGHAIGPGETCVDLGASPGSWSYVALRRGASVQAVDRSPLRADLMNHPRLRFQAGDAFAFKPASPVDWLICDVIAAPERTLELLRRWLAARWCRRFVVTVKFKGTADYPLLDPLKAYLPTVCSEFRLTRLCANHNEACVAGIAARPDPAAS